MNVRKRTQRDRRQQAERPPYKVEMPPAFIDAGLQDNGNRHRQYYAAQQQDAKADFAVAEGSAGTRGYLPTDCRRAQSAQRQRNRRRGYRKPHRDVIPRHGVRRVNLAHKQV